jgi:hypothetical protein
LNNPSYFFDKKKWKLKCSAIGRAL